MRLAAPRPSSARRHHDLDRFGDSPVHVRQESAPIEAKLDPFPEIQRAVALREQRTGESKPNVGPELEAPYQPPRERDMIDAGRRDPPGAAATVADHARYIETRKDVV